MFLYYQEHLPFLYKQDKPYKKNQSKDMDNKLIKIVIATLVLSSCTEFTNREYNIIDFESNINNFKSIKLSEIVYELEYVTLETKPELLLEEIKCLDILGDKIVVADKNTCL